MSIWPHAMSYLRPSSEVDLVSPVIACFVAVYGAEFGLGAWAEIEPLLMMRPPLGSWAFIWRNASCVHRKAPVKLVLTAECHWSYVRSSSGTEGENWPALLNRRSSLPNSSFVLVKTARTDAGSPTWEVTASIRTPEARPSVAVTSSGSERRPDRSEEHTSELQSRPHLVCRLLLEKKKKKN